MVALGPTALLVRFYDEAIAWYGNVLGLRLVSDDDLGNGKRWVVMSGETGGALLLAQANKPGELAAVGNQHGGRVGFFLEVEDFGVAYNRLKAAGASFDEEPRHEPYGTVAVFRDLYGNRWDLIEPKRA